MLATVPHPPVRTDRRDPPAARRTAHLFTVDVEEYFHAAALAPAVMRAGAAKLESRVRAQVDVLLELLAAHGAHGTFFTLGSVAAECPRLVRDIADAGHEVASHGWSHQRVTALRPDSFRDEVRRSKAVLEGAARSAVIGFRAPNFSIVRGCEWAWDVLLEEGYLYDSSVFPGRSGHPADAPTAPYPLRRRGGTLTEVPLTFARFGPVRMPAAGGAFFRLFPPSLTRRALLQAEARGEPGVFYLHPWEIDPGQPRMAVSALTGIRHYGGLGEARARVEEVLGEFSFTSVARHLEAR
ncbi:MAG: DUF3473 domain-containing protein [Gemmatimonadetes bacterium]|nr:DUF3473 domain-containing protein [Gemmatimonadota bacterium]